MHLAHALPVLIYFFVGIYLGFMSYHKELISGKHIVVLSTLYFIMGSSSVLCIMSMALFCFAFEYLPLLGSIKKLLKAFGNYTLEIYVLHLTLYSLILIIERRYDIEVPYISNMFIMISKHSIAF